MASVEMDDDYYAILEIPPFATADTIKKSYRRLAILRHPDKNQNSLEATASFQLLINAYETLRDENLRMTYDFKWPGIVVRIREAKEKARRVAEAARVRAEEIAEAARLAREKAEREKAKIEAEQRQRKKFLEKLESNRRNLCHEFARIKQAVAKVEQDLRGINVKEAEEIGKAPDQHQWWTVSSDKPSLLAEIKREREIQRLQWLAVRRINEERLKALEQELDEVSRKYASLRLDTAAEVAEAQAREEQREQDAAAKAEKAHKYAEDERVRQADFEQHQRKVQQEAAAKRKADEDERCRKAAESEKRRTEAEQRIVQAARAQQEKAQRAEEQREAEERIQQAARAQEEEARRAEEEQEELKKAALPKPTPCQHKSHWKKAKKGNLQCQNCQAVQGRFVFRCPQCQMKACDSCRKRLQKGRV